jgi:hypothetical protein
VCVVLSWREQAEVFSDGRHISDRRSDFSVENAFALYFGRMPDQA